MADIFRHRGPAWRASHAGHVSLGQLKVMSAIERCRTAALGGHVERQAELLPVPYFHVASVTTASSPTPTGPTTSYWPAGSSAYHTRLPGALTAIARTVVTKTKSGIFVLAAVGVWSPSRPSSPAASRDWGPFQQSASTAHDQHAPVAIPHCRASSRPMSHRRRLPSANRNCQRRLPPPKRRSLTTTPPFRSGTRRPKPTLR